MKYFLIFFTDMGNREDCNSYYTTLVIANDQDEAWQKYSLQTHSSYARDNFEILEAIPII